MSLTTRPAPRLTPRGRIILIATMIAAGSAIAASAIVPAAGGIARAAGRAQPIHWPDISLLAAAPAIVQVHFLSATAALALGAVMLTSRKGARFHRVAGWTWAGLMALVAGSAAFVTSEDGRWSFIHLTILWVVALLPPAVLAARRHNVRRHRGLMLWLYFAVLVGSAVFTFVPGRLMWELFFA